MSFDEVFAEHQRVVAASAKVLPTVLTEAAELLISALKRGSKLLICGNGGSAADAQHFAAELIGRFEAERRALPVVALSTDTSALTALANDYGFHTVFSRQVEALAQPGDVLLALSTSGGSENVLRAADAALSRDCAVLAFTGEGGGALRAKAQVCIAVPSTNVARIQEVHELCLHALAGAVEAAFLPGAES